LNIDLEINNENQQLIAVNQKGATDLCKYLWVIIPLTLCTTSR
jgi:hypothetical protein